MALTLLDTNVLVHAAAAQSPLHVAAARLVDRGLKTDGIFCLAPQNLVEFAAVMTRPRNVSPPLTPSDVGRMVDVLYRSRRLKKIYPSRGTVLRAVRYGERSRVSGPVWYDLFLAFTMADAGVDTIVTEDVRHFRQFSFLKVLSIEEWFG